MYRAKATPVMAIEMPSMSYVEQHHQGAADQQEEQLRSQPHAPTALIEGDGGSHGSQLRDAPTHLRLTTRRTHDTPINSRRPRPATPVTLARPVAHEGAQAPVGRRTVRGEFGAPATTAMAR